MSLRMPSLHWSEEGGQLCPLFLFVVLPRSPIISAIMDVVVFKWMLIVLCLILRDIHFITVVTLGM